MSAETLRKWLRQSEVEAGEAAGVTTESARQIRELKRKNAALERPIEILKETTAFFVRECAAMALICQFIASRRQEYGVAPICRAPGVLDVMPVHAGCVDRMAVPTFSTR